MASLDWKYPVLDVPDGGLAIDRTGTADDMTNLAKELEILAVEKLRLTGRLRSAGEGRYHLDGTLVADVAQACVVTLDPVPERLSIALAIDFVPQHLMPPPIPEAGEEDDETEGAKLFEPIVNGVVDIGDLVFQEIAAALDPYPRLADAALDTTEAGPDASEANNPFAKLRELKVTKDER